MEESDTELTILESIFTAEKRKNEMRQRDLAHVSGLSLGMINALLKRFSQKGWIIVKRINKRNLSYTITPEGIHEIARRSFRYFRRTIQNVSFYKDLLDGVLSGKRKEGFSGVLLLGTSDLEFIVEFLSEKNGLLFMQSFIVEEGKNRKLTGKYLHVFSESVPEPEREEGNEIYLSSILAGPAQ